MKNLIEVVHFTKSSPDDRGINVQRRSVKDGSNLTIRDGETAVMLGPMPAIEGTGQVKIEGTGKLVNIYGDEGCVVVFDETNIMKASKLKVHADGRLHLPVFVTDPAADNGDLWITDASGAGTDIKLKIKVGGVVKTLAFV